MARRVLTVRCAEAAASEEEHALLSARLCDQFGPKLAKLLMSLVPRELPPDLVTEGFVVSELARFVTKEHFDAESARFMTKEHFDAVMARWAQDAADQREAERNERVAQRELDRKERDAQREADRERLDAQRAEDRRYVDVRMERLERRLRRVQYMLPLELAAGAAGLVVVLQWLDGGG